MSFMALAGAIGAGATALGASAGVASVVGAVGAGAIGGAGLGALSSAITGGDVGKGALFGALGGGLTGGLGSAVGAMGGSAAGSTAGAGASTAAGGAANAAGNAAANTLANTAGSTLSTATSAEPILGAAFGAPSMGIAAPAAGAAPIASAAPIAGAAAPSVGIAGIPAPYTPPTLPMSPIPAGSSAVSGLPTGIPAPATPPALPYSPVGSGAQLAQTSAQLPVGMEGMAHLTEADLINAGLQNSYFGQNPFSTIMLGSSLGSALQGFTSGPTSAMPAGYDTGAGPLEFYKFRPRRYRASQPMYIKPANYADGGIASLNPDSDMMQSGPAHVDFMGEDAYPMSQQKLHFYSTPTQMPTSAQQAMASYEPSTNPLTGQPISHFDEGGIAQIPVGGKLLRGPGDGVSDDIPANIEGRQEARLADGEYVVPARAVSELGNGSTDAGAKKLSAMVDRIQQRRRKSMGRKKIAVDSKAHRAMPV